MKILITLLKPLSFLPALLMMYLIFSFSAQTGEVSGELSYKISYKIVEIKSEVLHQEKSYDELYYEADQIHFYVRKAAHMTEYFLLAIAVSFPLYVYRVRGFWLFLELSVSDSQGWMNTISPLLQGAVPLFVMSASTAAELLSESYLSSCSAGQHYIILIPPKEGKLKK